MLRLQRLSLAVGAAIAVSCQSDPAITVPDRNEEYVRNFIKEFGIPDPDHTWNMATAVTATTSGLPAGSKVYVYDEMPGTEGAQLAATFSGTTCTFDFPDGLDNAYIQVVDRSGRVIMSGSRPVSNGTIEITMGPGSRTRGEGIPADMALKIINMDPYFAGISNKGIAAEFWGCEESKVPRLAQTSDFAFLINDPGIGSNPFDSSTSGILKSDNPIPENTWVEGNGVSLKTLQSIVGPKGVFNENLDADGDCNLMKYWGDLTPDDGVCFISDGGEVELEYFYGCGTYRNVLGYFFFDDSYTPADIMHAPKYVLIYEASPWRNLQRYDPDTGTWSTFEDLGKTENDHSTRQSFLDSNDPDSYQINQSGMHPAYDVEQYSKRATLDENHRAYYDKVRYRGSTHKIVYFPQQKDPSAPHGIRADYASPTYTVPQGMKVGFFLMSDSFAPLYFGKKGTIAMNKIRFSLPWMHKAIGQVFDRGHHLCEALDEDVDSPWFVTYKWGNEYIMGVEDGANYSSQSDHDMNDILFKVRGAEPYPRKVRDMGYNVNMQTWIVACEDLGNTWDYDFNDMIFAVSHVKNDNPDEPNRLYVTPLAKGGTLPIKLCYNGEPIDGGKFWHEYFSASAGTVINAKGDGSTAKYPEAILVDADAPDDYMLSHTTFYNGRGLGMGGFSVEVYDGDVVTNRRYTVTPPAVGDGVVSSVPQMILLPGTWSWPQEGVRIQEAYPKTESGTGGFAAWVGNRSHTLWSTLKPDNGLLFKNHWEGMPVPEDMRWKEE